jgi:hypothetical protein
MNDAVDAWSSARVPAAEPLRATKAARSATAHVATGAATLVNEIFGFAKSLT